MTTTERQRSRPRETPPEEFKWVLTVLGSPGVYIGLAAGVAAGLYAIHVHHFLKDEQTTLLFLGSSDVVLLAVILTATTVATSFLQGFFGRVTQTAGGLLTFFFPFILPALVSGAGALISFGAAMNVDSHVHETIKASLFGLAAFFTTWAIAGAMWLTISFTRKASEQREMLTDAEDLDARINRQLAAAEKATHPGPTTGVAAELERSMDLHRSGALTNAEFATAKAKALERRSGFSYLFRERP